MDIQCVTAEQIAQAFMQLLRADQQAFVLLLAICVFIMSGPSIIHRFLDIWEARQGSSGVR